MNDSELKYKKQLASAFEAVFDAPSKNRAELLTSICGPDTKFRLEIEKMLKAAGSLDEFLEKPLAEKAIGIFEKHTSGKLLGKQIGKYVLRSVIGRGGMGTVFLGERADDFEQRVAIKIISPLATSNTEAEIFKRERQILASLEHPAISRLLDAGTAKDGTPYLVMEYVKGISLIKYCSMKNLSVSKRLELFMEVCRAVKFAHQNLVIHRDLKPTNILVTEEGKPKLLDFGIAKMLLARPINHAPDITVTTKILTPNYASPEQLKGELITTASDVYSLGVILYEMMTGIRPHEFQNKSLPEIIRAISTERPEKPHLAGVTSSDQTRPLSSQKKGVSDYIDPKNLKGDLDTIILKALEKDVTDRYQTVEQLTDDINRYQNNLPILAKPPSTIYRIRKFALRNQLPVVSICLALVFGLILVVASIWFARVSGQQAFEYQRQAYSSDMNLAMQSYEAANIVRVRQILDQYQDYDLRGWEYYFLKRLINPASRLAMLEHPSEVWHVSFSRDGTQLATACADGFARIYEVPSGRLISKTAVKESNVWKVDFSPDGNSLATASGDSESTSVKVWDTRDGKEMFALRGHSDRIRAIKYSPDGKMIATGSRDGTIRLWDSITGKENKEIKLPYSRGRPTEIHDLSFSPDGSNLLSANEDFFSVYELSSEKTRINRSVRFLAAAYSPDGKNFALGTHNSTIEIYDSKTVKRIRTIPAHGASVHDIAYSPDGNFIASASSDRTIRVFDATKGTELTKLRTHSSDVWSVAYSPNSKFFASGGTDFRAQLYDREKLVQPVATGIRVGFSRQWVAISADRKSIASGSIPPSNFIKPINDLHKKESKLEFSNEVINAGAFSNNGLFLATLSLDGSIAIWNTSNGKEVRRFKAHTKPKGRFKSGSTIAFSPNGKLLISGGFDRRVKVWNPETGKLVRQLHEFGSRVSQVGISRDGSRIFAADFDANALLFDTESGNLISNLGKQKKPILSIAFSPDGKTMATGTADGSIKTWSLKNGKHLKSYPENAGFVWQLTYSPNGRRIVSANSEGLLRVWDTDSALQVLTIKTDSAVTNLLAFTTDGKTLISHGTKEEIRLWKSVD